MTLWYIILLAKCYNYWKTNDIILGTNVIVIYGMTDRQSFNVRWDHRLCQVPPAPSQSTLSLFTFIVLWLKNWKQINASLLTNWDEKCCSSYFQLGLPMCLWYSWWSPRFYKKDFKYEDAHTNIIKEI